MSFAQRRKHLVDALRDGGDLGIRVAHRMIGHTAAQSTRAVIVDDLKRFGLVIGVDLYARLIRQARSFAEKAYWFEKLASSGLTMETDDELLGNVVGGAQTPKEIVTLLNLFSETETSISALQAVNLIARIERTCSAAQVPALAARVQSLVREAIES